MFKRLFPRKVTGFGSAGISRQRELGAILIYGDFAGQMGVEFDEAGMSIESFTCRYYLAVNNKMMSNVGEPRARARSDKFSRDIQMSGEMTGSDYASSVASAIDNIANDVDDFGDGSGDILLDEATVGQNRGDWRKIAISLSSDPYVVGT